MIGKFDAENLKVMEKGIELFNARYYWECHEELEHHWLESRGDNARYIYWAVIQVAAAMVHFETDNLIGVQGMLKKARDKIRRGRESHVESDILLYNLDWVRFSKLVEMGPEKGELDEYQAIYRFQFPSPAQWRYT